jgi:hypothetical protein
MQAVCNCYFKVFVSTSLPARNLRMKAARLVVGFPPRRPGLESGSGHVGFVVDEVALGWVFFSTSVSQLISIPPIVPQTSSIIWAGTIGQTVAAVPSGLSRNP